MGLGTSFSVSRSEASVVAVVLPLVVVYATVSPIKSVWVFFFASYQHFMFPVLVFTDLVVFVLFVLHIMNNLHLYPPTSPNP